MTRREEIILNSIENTFTIVLIGIWVLIGIFMIIVLPFSTILEEDLMPTLVSVWLILICILSIVLITLSISKSIYYHITKRTERKKLEIGRAKSFEDIKVSAKEVKRWLQYCTEEDKDPNDLVGYKYWLITK